MYTRDRVLSHDHQPPRHRRRSLPVLVATLAAVAALPSSAVIGTGNHAMVHAAGAITRNPHASEAGDRAGPATQLVDGRTITPAGTQSSLGDLPLNAVLSPDGTHLLVANGGAGVQSVQVVSTKTGGVVQTIPYYAVTSTVAYTGGVVVGLAYSSGGTRAYASGGGQNVIHVYSVQPTGTLSPTANINLGTAGSLYPALGNGPWPLGLSAEPNPTGADGERLFVAENLANAVAVIDTNGVSSTIAYTVPVGMLPYTTLVDPTDASGRRVYVSNWGDNTISIVNAGLHAATAYTITVGLSNTVGAATSHPTAMAMDPSNSRYLYVALSNSDAIAVVDVRPGSGQHARVVAYINDRPYAGAPLGTAPVSLAFGPDGTLYVANAGGNNVAAYRVDYRSNGTYRGATRQGRIPTAWYPTAVVPSIDGRTLFVTNGYGVGTGPNDSRGNTATYPNPTRPNPAIADGITGYADGYCNCLFEKYSGSMTKGTLSTIQTPSRGRLRVYSAEVAVDNRESDSTADDRDLGNPIPTAGQPYGSSPIQHVIYIVKENRTYDQVFGDENRRVPGSDGDPSLTLFGRDITPNLHALGEQFGLLDNFYADAEVSADGHNWINSAYASDYNEKMWPQDYSPAVGRNRGYDFEGGSTINLSPGGYLWDAAARAGISYKDYGEFVNNGPLIGQIPAASAASCPGPVATSYVNTPITTGNVLCFGPTSVTTATTPALVGHIDPKFRSYDLRYSDDDRVTEWARDNGFLGTGTPSLPALTILRLPNDHTAGTRPGFPTPQAYVAQNDAAVGRVVDLVSHSPLWGSTAIFVTEDDAQNGPDHVDAHRTEALVISPYTAQGEPAVDHTLYDTAAMVRTIELILGLPALSQFDANATPMWRAFTSTADTTPYDAYAATTPISTVNTAASYGAQASLGMDFSREDRAPAAELNHILWHAVKGSTPYPVGRDGNPVRGSDRD